MMRTDRRHPIRPTLPLLLTLCVTAASTPARAADKPAPAAESAARPADRPAGTTATPPPAALTAQKEKRPPPVAFGALVNPVETGISTAVNKLVLVSPVLLLGDGRGACVINPQFYALTDTPAFGVGALVGFRVFSGTRYDGAYFGVRFGGGVGSHSFKTFMGQIDAGWAWAFGAFRLGLGVNAGGGYVAHADDRGALYLFSLDLSVGFALGRFHK